MQRYECISGHAVLVDDDVRLPGRVSIGSHGYGQIFVNGRVTLLHRWLMGLEVGDRRQVDHINRNRLDCRRENLRIVSQAENTRNRAPGCVYRSRSGRWYARAHRNYRAIHLGTFGTQREAAAAVAEWRTVNT